ncbi:MAG: hypothetical protein K5872_21625 [Rhizobiaceae bacterium]|nr:hypothetical protein [Rhizobiaceae bacterium]MCV0408819.1 hypothetical protein [Rhizobiaceae bacterium]
MIRLDFSLTANGLSIARSLAVAAAIVMSAAAPLHAQDPSPSFAPDAGINLPPIDAPVQNYAPPRAGNPLAAPGEGTITLSAKLVEGGPDITRGLVWRIFGETAGEDGTLPLVASARGGVATLSLEPGSYLVHASFGRAGATKRIRIGPDFNRESVVLEAGGLKLDALLSGGVRIPPDDLRFSIYEQDEDATGERPLIIPNVKPGTVVRLNSGTYHVVSRYGDLNARVAGDIRVEAGKVTEATMEHRAAELTVKLVRQENGEALADTSWTIVDEAGETVREEVGAFASMVLAEGSYTAVAKNRERVFSRDFVVVPGRNQDVEVIAAEGAAAP